VFYKLIVLLLFKVMRTGGRAVAQSCRPTAAALVRARSGHMGFVADKVTLGRVFSEYFGFPFQSSFRQIVHPHNHPGHVQ
jgi:hypothetical protein